MDREYSRKQLKYRGVFRLNSLLYTFCIPSRAGQTELSFVRRSSSHSEGLTRKLEISVGFIEGRYEGTLVPLIARGFGDGVTGESVGEFWLMGVKEHILRQKITRIVF